MTPPVIVLPHLQSPISGGIAAPFPMLARLTTLILLAASLAAVAMLSAAASQAQQGALSRTGTMEWAEPNGNDCIMPEHGVTFCAGRVSRAEGGQFSAPAAPGSG